MHDSIQRLEVMSTVTKEMLFEDYINNIHIPYFLNNIKPSTIDNYILRYNNDILPVLGQKRICDITSLEIQNLMISLEHDKHMCSNTILTEFCLINKAFRILKAHHIIDYNVCDAVEKVKVKFNRTKTIDLRDLKKILKYIRNTKDELIVLLSLNLGLRKGEVYALRWKNINFEKALISITDNKIYIPRKGYIISSLKTDSSNRILKIPKYLLKKLKKWKKRQAKLRKKYGDKAVYNDFICTHEDGSEIGPGYINDRLKIISRNLKLDYNITMRSLRSTVATLLAYNNEDIYNISKFLGHTNTQTTALHYIVHIDSSFDNIAKKLNKLFTTKRF